MRKTVSVGALRLSSDHMGSVTRCERVIGVVDGVVAALLVLCIRSFSTHRRGASHVAKVRAKWPLFVNKVLLPMVVDYPLLPKKA